MHIATTRWSVVSFHCVQSSHKPVVLFRPPPHCMNPMNLSLHEPPFCFEQSPRSPPPSCLLQGPRGGAASDSTSSTSSVRSSRSSNEWRDAGSTGIAGTLPRLPLRLRRCRRHLPRGGRERHPRRDPPGREVLRTVPGSSSSPTRLVGCSFSLFTYHLLICSFFSFF